mgnify:CR=1 FL=1
MHAKHIHYVIFLTYTSGLLRRFLRKSPTIFLNADTFYRKYQHSLITVIIVIIIAIIVVISIRQ